MGLAVRLSFSGQQMRLCITAQKPIPYSSILYFRPIIYEPIAAPGIKTDFLAIWRGGFFIFPAGIATAITGTIFLFILQIYHYSLPIRLREMAALFSNQQL